MRFASMALRDRLSFKQSCVGTGNTSRVRLLANTNTPWRIIYALVCVNVWLCMYLPKQPSHSDLYIILSTPAMHSTLIIYNTHKQFRTKKDLMEDTEHVPNFFSKVSREKHWKIVSCNNLELYNSALKVNEHNLKLVDKRLKLKLSINTVHTIFFCFG